MSPDEAELDRLSVLYFAVRTVFVDTAGTSSHTQRSSPQWPQHAAKLLMCWLPWQQGIVFTSFG